MAKQQTDDRFNKKIEAIRRYNRELKNSRELEEEILQDLESKIEAQNREIAGLEDLTRKQKELAKLEQEETKTALEGFRERIKQQNELQKKLGVTGQMFKGMEKSLSKLGMSEKHFKKINKEMEKAALNGNGMTAALKGFTTQAKLLGQGILKDPAIQAGIITNTLKKGMKIMDYFESSAFELQKELGLGWKSAETLNKNLFKAATTTTGLKSTYKELVHFQAMLNKSTGLTNSYTAKQLDTQMKLVKLAGLSNEEAAKFQEFSDISGESAENIHDQIVAQNDSLVSNKSLLQEVANVGGEIRADYKGSHKELAKAVLQTRKLGISLKQAKNMSMGLLDFEASIEAEMEAELLTGKDLNMEKARYLSMQGKSAEAADELLKNLGSAAEFENMSVMAKQSMAKAMNMEVGALSESLYKREQYNALEAPARKALQERVAQLRKAGEIEKANAVEKAGLQQEDIKLAEKRFTTVEEARRQAEKAKDTMLSSLAEPMTRVANLLNDFFKYMDNNPWLKTALKGIGAAAALIAVGASIVSGAKMIANLFTGGIGKMFGGKLGSSPMNPMYVSDVGGGGGGGMDLISNVLGKRSLKLGNFFKKTSKLFKGNNKLSKIMNKGFRNMAAMSYKRSSFANQIVRNNKTLSKIIPSMSKLTSKVPGGVTAASKTSLLGKTGSVLSKGGSKLLSGAAKGLKALGPIGAIADVAIGGFTGYQASKLSKEQKKAQGIREDMGAGEATALGVLTGDASKGSSLSKYVGVKKGSAGDEAMGVAGAAGRGALVGAAVGSVVPVVGTAVGAVAGGIIGAGSELVKVFSDPNSKLRKGVEGFGKDVKEKAGQAFSWMGEKAGQAWEGLKGGASKWWEFQKEGFSQVASLGKKALGGLMSGAKSLWNGMKGLASSALDGLKNAGNAVVDTAKKGVNLGKEVLKAGVNVVTSGVSSVWEGIKSLAAADGAIFPGSFTPLTAFANGGIATRPTVGLIAEAGMNEAMVPLPDGKNIPVKMNNNNNKALEAKFDKLINVLTSHPEIKVNLELDGTKLIDTLSIAR